MKDTSEIEARILELCQQFPKGFTDKVLQNDMQGVDSALRVQAINRLLNAVQCLLLNLKHCRVKIIVKILS